MEQERIRAQGEITTQHCTSDCPNIVLHGRQLLGLDGFDHMDLPELILGKYPYIPHYVG